MYAVPHEGGKVIHKFDNSALDLYFRNINRFNLPETFLISLTKPLFEEINQHRNRWHALKVNLFLECTFYTQKSVMVDDVLEQNTELINTNYKTKNEIILGSTNIENYLSKSFEKIINELDSFESKGGPYIP